MSRLAGVLRSKHPRLTDRRLLLPASLIVALFMCSYMLPGSDAYGRATSARHSTSSLVVHVSGLSPGVAAGVVVRGPHFSTTLKGSRTIRHIRPGRYTFTVRQVTIAGGHHVRAGSLALPARRHEQVQVRAGQTTAVGLQYGTIINANVRRLSLKPISVHGDTSNPSSLILAARVNVGVGTILTARPSPELPAGLFHKVIGIRRSGHRTILKLKPAQLTEAFSQLDINSTVAFTPGKASVGEVRSAGFEPLNASLGIGNFRCQLPLADSRLTAQQSFGINADVQLHIPIFFGITDGLPEGRLALTLKASASLEALIRKNTGCSAEVSLPPLPGAIPVGPVVVPVYAQVGIFGSATIGSDLQVKTSAGFSLTAGMEFHGTSIHNISRASANASASATASGAGTLSVGPQIRFAVGVASVADVHLDVRPSLAFTAALDGSCSLNLVAGSRAGISLGLFQLNQNLPAPTATLYRCPQPPAATHLSIEQTGPPPTDSPHGLR